MTAEMSVQGTLALIYNIRMLVLSFYCVFYNIMVVIKVNPSVEIGKQDKLKLYWLAL
jgi:hypothetical protein